MNVGVIGALGVLAGALLTVAGGLIGAWIQGRREHRRWLRERRYAAFVTVLTLINQMEDIDADVRRVREEAIELPTAARKAELDSIENRLRKVADGFHACAAEFTVLGPDSVEGSLNRVASAMRGRKAVEEAVAARGELKSVMRATIGTSRKR
ncbi:hypothetical protein [Humibacter sp.]|uniref:hypothetical protein n=1 Tax=Humibacter sp. TaxID=1940291 RepID=UPI002C0357E9|nr:hypothetical protein [Humibacter sp.]HVX08064.1 hypothetical protein [Humibacter sp.]